MEDPKFKDHFSQVAADYASYRPSYPQKLADVLAELSPAQDRALDCACGTGQLSVLLAKRFKEVIATDGSADQIAQAQPQEGVIYRTALAENSGLPDGSVDLITVAQAAHWLDLEAFYTEVQRIARPDALLALITYGVLHVEGEVDSVMQHFYYETIGAYWPPERRHVEDGYRSLVFPFQELSLPPLAIEVDWNLPQLLGYIRTWSAVKAAEKALGSSVLIEVEAELRKQWGDPDQRRRINWPLSVRAGRVRK